MSLESEDKSLRAVGIAILSFRSKKASTNLVRTKEEVSFRRAFAIEICLGFPFRTRISAATARLYGLGSVNVFSKTVPEVVNKALNVDSHSLRNISSAANGR